MYESDQKKSIRNYVAAKNRRDGVKKLIEGNPTLKGLYDPGPNDDGKGGWINAIKDQHGQVYRLLFYIDRLPLGIECEDKESYEILYGEIGENDEPNFPRALFTTTGGINLMRDSIPGTEFSTAIQTTSAWLNSVISSGVQSCADAGAEKIIAINIRIASCLKVL